MMGRLKPGSGTGSVAAQLSPLVLANLPEAAARDLRGEAPKVDAEPGSHGLEWSHDPLPTRQGCEPLGEAFLEPGWPAGLHPRDLLRQRDKPGRLWRELNEPSRLTQLVRTC